jgi:argininosuccinate lyase
MGQTERDRAGDRSAFPAPTYRKTVLEPIFRDALHYFLEPLLAIQYAHTLMLGRQGILNADVVIPCLQALEDLNLDQMRNTKYDGSFEDLFFFMQQKLGEQCGIENAGKMHTARSRNDIDLTMYRMVLRARLTDTIGVLLSLRKQLIDLAWEHRASLMPAYTHNQPAQPTTLGHYLMAVIECLERDTTRLQSAFGRVNQCPLGACAITTTGFPIDRFYTAALLGFDSLQINSYGAIAAVDYLTESCSVLSVCMLNLGRFAQDLLQWSAVEFGYLRLSDGYVQISSIMPQKRNPVALEHVRALSSRALTQSQSVLGSLHNTPFTDINDAEDDLQPLVYSAFEDAHRSLELFAGILAEVDFDTAKMAIAAGGSFLTVTELADTLVRSTGMSFRIAHEIVSQGVKELDGHYDAQKMAGAVERILAVSHPEYSIPDPLVLRQALQAAHFVALRRIPGGPAPEALEPEIHRAQQQLGADRVWLQDALNRLESARQRVRTETLQLLASNSIMKNNP